MDECVATHGVGEVAFEALGVDVCTSASYDNRQLWVVTEWKEVRTSSPFRTSRF